MDVLLAVVNERAEALGTRFDTGAASITPAAQPTVVPIGNPEGMTSPGESGDNRPNGRSLRAYVVRYSRAVPVAGRIAG